MNRPFWAASILSLVFCVLAMIGTPPAGKGREIVYVLDVSRSHGPAPDLLRDRLNRWHEQSPYRDRAFRVVLAGTGAMEGGEVTPAFAEGSRVDLGLEMARRTRGTADTVVVLSDGRFDHAAVMAQVRALAAEGVTVRFAGPLAAPALDVRLLPRGVARVEGDAARVRVGVTGTHREPRRVTLTAARDSGSVRAEILVPPGAVEEWEALVPVPPAARTVTVRLALEDGPDAVPANDELVVPVERDRRRALVLGPPVAVETSTLAEALVMTGFDVEGARDLSEVGTVLEGLDLLVLVDQPLAGAPAEYLREIESAVTDGALGLLVVGGEHAFGAGGYGATRFDELLPLSSRPADPHRVTIVLDTSGSMERDARLGRAIDAIATLAQSLGPDDRLQVIPFAQEAGAPVPPSAAAPQAFLATAMPVLRRIAPRGGTRLLPALDAALAVPRDSGTKPVFIVVTDARDDEVLAKDLEDRRQAMVREKIESVVVLLDPNTETRRRAAFIATTRVIEVADYGPRILIQALEPDAYTPDRIESATPDGRPGPVMVWRNRVRAGAGAAVALATRDGAPLLASAFRGVGRTAAWAAWPRERDQARGMAAVWAGNTARPAEWRKISARRTDRGLEISVPPERVPEDGLRVRGGAAPVLLAERSPGLFEITGNPRDSGYLTLLDRDAVFAVVPVPPPGDPEYAWPPVLPPSGPEGQAAPSARLRAPWALGAALCWAAAVRFRRRRS